MMEKRRVTLLWALNRLWVRTRPAHWRRVKWWELHYRVIWWTQGRPTDTDAAR
jgi:hypothetical protein